MDSELTKLANLLSPEPRAIRLAPGAASGVTQSPTTYPNYASEDRPESKGGRIARQKALLLVFLVIGGVAPMAFSQAVPAATQNLRLSAFGGISGIYTGFNSGRNLGITLGVDIGFLPHSSFYPSLVVRGTYPVDKGQIDSQKNVLVGPKVSLHYRRIYPYADFLVGRGQINYHNGAPNPARNALYVQSVSNVFSPGAGLDFQLSERFSVKADAHFQRYSSPVTESRHLFATSLTLGIGYRFSFDHHH